MNGVRVKNVDISRLEPGRWLNDIIIDAYASLFPVDSSSFVHTCFFYARLGTDSLDRLARFYAARGRLLSWSWRGFLFLLMSVRGIGFLFVCVRLSIRCFAMIVTRSVLGWGV